MLFQINSFRLTLINRTRLRTKGHDMTWHDMTPPKKLLKIGILTLHMFLVWFVNGTNQTKKLTYFPIGTNIEWAAVDIRGIPVDGFDTRRISGIFSSSHITSHHITQLFFGVSTYVWIYSKPPLNLSCDGGGKNANFFWTKVFKFFVYYFLDCFGILEISKSLNRNRHHWKEFFFLSMYMYVNIYICACIYIHIHTCM